MITRPDLLAKYKLALKPQFQKPKLVTDSPISEITSETVLVNESAAGALGIEVNKPEAVAYNLMNQASTYEFLTFKETEYTKQQKDLKRLDKMENKLTESYSIEDVNGKKITIRVPQRLGYLVKEPE